VKGSSLPQLSELVIDDCPEINLEDLLDHAIFPSLTAFALCLEMHHLDNFQQAPFSPKNLLFQDLDLFAVDGTFVERLNNEFVQSWCDFLLVDSGFQSYDRVSPNVRHVRAVAPETDSRRPKPKPRDVTRQLYEWTNTLYEATKLDTLYISDAWFSLWPKNKDVQEAIDALGQVAKLRGTELVIEGQPTDWDLDRVLSDEFIRRRRRSKLQATKDSRK
jgi:hypothetical protein